MDPVELKTGPQVIIRETWMIQIHIQNQPQDPNPKIFFAFPTPSKKKTEKKGRKIKEKKDCSPTKYSEEDHKISSSAAAAMACASQSMISASSCSFLSSQRILKKPRWVRASTKLFSVNASSSTSEDDCNVEECAPEKEVGKVSMEWLAGEKTQVTGTFPPKKKGWTGYVEKDTAGQTNIYSVEPAVYVAESVMSSGSSGTSSEGAENTAAIAAGLALISIAAASSILLQVDKKAPQAPSMEYSGPPLSYYINKFKPASIVEATTLPEPQTSPTVEASVPSEDTGSSTVEASVPSEPQITSSAPPEVSGNAVPEVQVEFKEAEF